nr:MULTISPECIES: DUF6527 family protein [unclassified Afipia]
MNGLSQFFRSAYRRIYNWIVPPYATLVVEEALPKKLKRRALYVVQEDGFEEQAAMICPCGCRSILHMNLLPDERPCWRVTRHDDGTATLNPSVWRKKECGSHFWFRNGRVLWC